MIVATDNLAAIEATVRSFIAKRGLGLDARIARYIDNPRRRTLSDGSEGWDEHRAGEWFWLLLLIDGEWHQIARRRDPRDLISVANRLSPAAVCGLNFGR